MSKSNKIDLKKVILTEDKNKLLHIKGFEDEEIPFENLTEKIEELIKLEQPLNIKITKARKSGGAGRKPIYKYKCKKCQKEISSKIEGLNIICKDCNEKYIPE